MSTATFWRLYIESARAVHIFAGITWIGLLYYFNFVQGFSFPKMEAPARSNAIMNLVPRALHAFRYSALATVLLGFAVIGGLSAQHSTYVHSKEYRVILVGLSFGLVMLFNVWLIIWPNQKKIIAATTATVKEGKPAPPEQAAWTRRATLASRANVMLSIPMLFMMVAAAHLNDLLWK
ncbi:MAG: urate hydroxylase PuuD [Chloroflexi bacterium]|nr:urate hydroxylase PuuD [Chloroflexota bacterium]